MRITFILPHAGLAGGIRVVAIYAERLKRLGHEVVIVSTPRSEPTTRQKLKSLIKGKGWSPKMVRESSHLDGIDVPHFILDRFRPVVDSDVPDADVVVATWWETAEWVDALSRSKGAKVYFVQHDERVMVGDAKPRIEATLRMPMHKITIAKWLVDMARDEFADHDVSLVPNAVDLQQFQASERVKQPCLTIGLMYSTAAFKGCDISIEALVAAQKKIPGIRIVVFGAKRPSAELPLPVEAEFHFQPAQDDLRKIYASCDAWLFGSRCEGFGLPILEAMACRTPVIGTPTGAAPELLSEGSGILVKHEDPHSMAEAIKRIGAMSQVEWRQMSDMAYRTAARYSWDNATKLFEKALEYAKSRSQLRETAGGMRKMGHLDGT